jgi:hypothetical protein
MFYKAFKGWQASLVLLMCKPAKHAAAFLGCLSDAVLPASACCDHRQLGYYSIACGSSSSSNAATDCSQQQPSPVSSYSTSPFAAQQPAVVPSHSSSTTSSNPLRGAVSFEGSSQATPVLFLHGVGGLLPYLEMLQHVIGLGHPVIVVECKHVSLRIW